MNIGVISDIHDRVDHLGLVIEQLRERSCVRIFCLGDICLPYTLHALAEMTVTIPVDIVYGNNDFDVSDFEQIALAHPDLTLHGDIATLAPGGIRVALTHMPEIARSMAHSGEYDMVFYGHTHVAAREMIGDCLLANPGEIMGKKGSIGYGILDLGSREFSLHCLLA